MIGLNEQIALFFAATKPRGWRPGEDFESLNLKIILT